MKRLTEEQIVKVEQERMLIERYWVYTRRENKKQSNIGDEVLTKEKAKEKLQGEDVLAKELLEIMDAAKLVQQGGRKVGHTEGLKNLKLLRMLVAAWRV